MKKDKWQQMHTNSAKPTQVQAVRLYAILAPKAKKRKIVGTEPTLPTIRNLSATFNKKERRITPSNQKQ